MKFKIDVDTRRFDRDIDALINRQIPFATSKAINETAKDFQAEQRNAMVERFIIRKRSFSDRSIKITQWAKKDNLTAVVAVQGVGREAKRDSVFAKFEQGGTKRAHSRDNPIAIPSDDIRPTRYALVPRALYPKNLRLVDRRAIDGGTMRAKTVRTKKGVKQWKGKRRTFILDPAEHRGVQVRGVYQRETKSDIRLLWVLKDSIPIPKLLRFRATARLVVRKVWTRNFNRALERALATAR